MIALAIDTSVRGCGVAIARRDGAVLARLFLETDRGQAEKLVPMIDDALARAGIGYDHLNAVAVTVGPGSFTGLRISIATARALGLSLSIPVMGFLTPDLMARQMAAKPRDRDLMIAIDTRRGDYYAAIYDPIGRRLRAPFIASQPVMDEALASGQYDVAGDAGQLILPDPAALATWAVEADAVPEVPEPVYIRDAETSQSKKNYKILEQ